MNRIGYQSKVVHRKHGVGTVITLFPKLSRTKSGAVEVTPRQWRVRFQNDQRVMWVPEADLTQL